MDLRRMTKEELLSKYSEISTLVLSQNQTMKSLRESLEVKEQVISDLKAKIENMEKFQTQIFTDEDTKKIILREHARERSVLVIFHEISKINSTITLEDINDIISNIDKLDKDLIEYFKEESQYYQKNKNIFSDGFKKNLLENELEDMTLKVSMLINKYTVKNGILDEEEFNNLMKLIDKFNLLSKQRIELTKHNEIQNQYTQQLDNKGTIYVNNVFNNLEKTFNLGSLGKQIEMLDIAEEVENYGK